MCFFYGAQEDSDDAASSRAVVVAAARRARPPHVVKNAIALRTAPAQREVATVTCAECFRSRCLCAGAALTRRATEDVWRGVNTLCAARAPRATPRR